MRNKISKVSKRLSNWIINTVELKQSDNVIKILAILKLIELLEGSLDNKLIVYLKDLINWNEKINYSSDSLLNSILASSIVLKYGNANSREHIKHYFSILFENKDFNQSPVNEIILNSMLNNLFKEKASKLEIEIPLFQLDIIKMINDVLFQIEVKTKFGLCKFENNALLNNKIEGMTIHAIRVYDFSTAMRCMRSLNYLDGNTSLAIKTVFDFIQHEQCLDGSFGDFETALSEIKDEQMRRYTRIELKLITTATILWALYESTNNNLIEQLFDFKKHIYAK